jgi:hypothetical protein
LIEGGVVATTAIAKTASTAPSSSRCTDNQSNWPAGQLNANPVNPDRSDQMDPNPDYDVSDEIEYSMNWFAWILRGVYPPPAYPPV